MDPIRQALDEIEVQREKYRAELAALTNRVKYLDQAAEGLRGVLGLGASPQPLLAAHAVGSASLSGEGFVSVSGSGSPSIGTPASRPLSTDAVRTILGERQGDSVHIDEIRAAFEERGWADPAWKNPQAAVYAAVQRLTDRDPDIVRTSRRHWKMLSPGEEAAREGVGLFGAEDADDQSASESQGVAVS